MYWVEANKSFGNIVDKVVRNFGLEVDADAVAAVNDLSSLASFQCAGEWIHSLIISRFISNKEICSKSPIFLFGNKLDLCYNNEVGKLMDKILNL